MWVGKAKLPAEAKAIYDMYLLQKQFGIRPWEINGSGEIYREDLTYLIALENFRAEAQQKWHDSSDNAGNINITR